MRLATSAYLPANQIFLTMPEAHSLSSAETLPTSSTTVSQLDLNSLLETSKILNASDELEFILSHIIRTVMGKFLLTRACVITESYQDNLEKVYRVALARGLRDLPKDFFDLDEFAKQFHLTLFPIISPKREIGYLGLGEKPSKAPFSDAEHKFIESLASLAATAIENAYTFAELRQQSRMLDQSVQKLRTLLELAKEYNVAMSRTEILRLMLRSISGQMFIKSCAAYLWQGESLVAEACQGFETAPASPQELQQLFASLQPVKLTAQTYPELYAADVRLAIPMRVNEQPIGLLLTSARYSETPFSESDIDFMALAAAQAANALEQRRLFEETLKKQAIEKELQVAREIQSALLPRYLPVIGGYDIAAINLPTFQVGGDYYDAMMLDDEHLFIAIADVTGKGMPAALLMANLQASIKAYLLSYQPATFDLSRFVGKINTIMYENTPEDKFVTFFCGILNCRTGVLESVNAGHNPPYLVRADGSLIALRKGGVILGVIPTLSPYQIERVILQSGDTLFLYTDGITEAMNAQREPFEGDTVGSLAYCTSLRQCSRDAPRSCRGGSAFSTRRRAIR
ncbi:MAG: SpoIIE family protein phosphatase [Chloroherpetonaceae bacterium]|nr:SpoIIE family protein phosphatase [Chloroherpetonaceae bacterium]